MEKRPKKYDRWAIGAGDAGESHGGSGGWLPMDNKLV